MKTFAHLSATGAVEAIVTLDAPDSIEVGLQPDPNQLIVEVQSPELAEAGGDVEKVRKILKQYKLAQPSSQPVKLTKA